MIFITVVLSMPISEPAFTLQEIFYGYDGGNKVKKVDHLNKG
jgi:hypothetical protein